MRSSELLVPVLEKSDFKKRNFSKIRLALSALWELLTTFHDIILRIGKVVEDEKDEEDTVDEKDILMEDEDEKNSDDEDENDDTFVNYTEIIIK